MNDLEQLLKQYGEDQRRQDTLARQLRLKTRRQHRALMMGGVALLAVAGILLLTTPKEASKPLMAEVSRNWQMPMPTTTVADGTGIEVSRRYSEVKTATAKDTEAVGTEATDDLVADGVPVDRVPVETVTNDEQNVIEVEEESSTVEKDPIRSVPPLVLADAYTVDLDEPQSRIWWDAHLCTSSGNSAWAQFPIGNNSILVDGLTEVVSLKEMTFSVQLLGMVSSNVGVSVNVASTGRSYIGVGIAAEGYLERMNVSVTQKRLYRSKDAGPHGTAGSYLTNMITRTSKETLYGIDLSVPLTWRLFLSGKERMGWQMRIAPARRMLMSDQLGDRYGLYINPWKLNMSVGVVLNKGVVKSVGVTANLLSTYQNSALHEFGIAVGF